MKNKRPHLNNENDKREDLTDKVYRFAGEASYIVLTSVLWLVFSLPIVTMPAATIGAYGMLSSHVIDGDKRYLKPFMTAFKSSVLTTRTLVGIGFLIFLGLITLNTVYYLYGSTSSSVMMAAAVLQSLLGAAVLVLSIYYFMFAAISYIRGVSDLTPGLRDSANLMARYPIASILLLGTTIGIPLLIFWLSLWQFAIFIAGFVCYFNVRILRRFISGAELTADI